MPESACFLNVAMANDVANLPATHPTSMFGLLKAVSVEERNFSGENSTLVYLYLKSSVQFTTHFCLIYVTAPLFPGGFQKKTNS